MLDKVNSHCFKRQGKILNVVIFLTNNISRLKHEIPFNKFFFLFCKNQIILSVAKEEIEANVATCKSYDMSSRHSQLHKA